MQTDAGSQARSVLGSWLAYYLKGAGWTARMSNVMQDITVWGRHVVCILRIKYYALIYGALP